MTLMKCMKISFYFIALNIFHDAGEFFFFSSCLESFQSNAFNAKNVTQTEEEVAFSGLLFFFFFESTS